MLTICTGWSPKGYTEYAWRFVESFAKHWPSEVRCLAFTEEPFRHPRIENHLLSEVPGCLDFIDLWRGIPHANGREQLAGQRWKSKELAAGYTYKFDAVKFCRQAFIPLHAAELAEGHHLCWLDADVVTTRDVPAGFIESLLPDGYDLAYLGRAGAHSEIGFQLYRIPQAREVLRNFRDTYASGRVFKLAEWHSAFVFDDARSRAQRVRQFNLTPNGSGHVWFQSQLGQYMDHCKGDSRKRRGHSAERPV